VPDEFGSVCFRSDGRSLITWGLAGLESRSIQQDDGATNVIRFGPPTRLIALDDSEIWREIWRELSPDGRFFVQLQPTQAAAVAFDLENPSPGVSLGPHSNIRSASISPSGRFVATGDSEGEVLKVWDVASRRLLRDLPTSGKGSAVFSPDGRWLATDGENYRVYRLYRAGSWELRWEVTVPHERTPRFNNFAFSPDGEVWAIGNFRHGILLYSTATGRRLAILEAPNQAEFYWLTFSPDGATLAVSQRVGPAQLWDLRQVRAQLAALHLDWEAPAYTPPIAQRQDKPIRIEIAENPARAERRAFLAREIPARSGEADARLIDLSRFYNAALTESWHEPTERNDLSELKPGLRELAGVRFDVRGLIQAGDFSIYGMPYGKAVTGIPINQSCARLHFLHSAIWANDAPAGTMVGAYTIHYADGRPEMEVPIMMGTDVLDWWSQPQENLADLTVAWTGENGKSRKTGHTIRLFKTTWNNPFPSVPIKQVDFVAHEARRAKPFLVAITAE
jgi:WD40 repeat protein